MRRLALNASAAGAAARARDALAGGNTVHELGGTEAFGQGDLDALSLDAEGILRPGPAFDAVALDAPTSWAATRSGGDLWIGTGNQGDVLRVQGRRHGRAHRDGRRPDGHGPGAPAGRRRGGRGVPWRPAPQDRAGGRR